MVNVAALAGLARPLLGGAPLVFYMHENQLTDPLPEGAIPDEGYAMANWVSMCAADVVAFNSEHHRSELLTALPRFLGRFRDHRHSSFLAGVKAKSIVLPVGIEPSLFGLEQEPTDGPPVVLWNHRWEYDKDPAAFFAALGELADDGVDFRLAVAGESFQIVPDEFHAAHERFADRLVHFGTAEPDEDVELLRIADVVVNTARHDFLGLAVAEAVAAGALPVLPRRLSYPELLPTGLADRWLYPDGQAPTHVLRVALLDGHSRRADAFAARRHLERLSWPNLISEYDRLLATVANSRVGTGVPA